MAVAALPFILGATAVAATAGSLYFGEKSAQAQKSAFKIQQQQADLTATKNRRDAIRTARIQSASAQQGAVNQNSDLSSGSQGGLGSIFSQFQSGLSFLDQSNTLSKEAGTELGKASTFGSYSNIFGSVSQLAETGYGFASKPASPKLDYSGATFDPPVKSQGFIGPP